MTRFLNLFTDLSLDEIAKLDALEGANINQAKIALANAATAMLHGADAARESEAAAAAVFAGGGSAEALPTADVPKAELEAGMLVAAAFSAAGLTKSNGDARRMIKQGAAKVNDVQVTDQNAVITLAHATADGAVKLSAGKKRHALIRPV